MDIRIRAYQKQDFDFCNALIEENMEPYFKEDGIVWDRDRYAREILKGAVYIADLRERRVGFFHLSAEGPDGYINIIQLDTAFQNRGMGSFMMNWIEELFRSEGKAGIQLRVFKDSPAVKFYKRLGYDVVEDSSTKYVMRKVL